uniref:Uncharacterized protein n=1 Tax=Myotis myotis TaxID=51298 RepID=A0A7J7XHI6_MYOMY|nr:hypothetical protein mMyoMyo1_011680 [Myotis myotis]
MPEGCLTASLGPIPQGSGPKPAGGHPPRGPRLQEGTASPPPPPNAQIFVHQASSITIVDRPEQLWTVTHSVCSFSCWPHLPKYQNLAPYEGDRFLLRWKCQLYVGSFFSREFCFSSTLFSC